MHQLRGWLPRKANPSLGDPGGPARPRHALVSAGPPQPRTLFLSERLDPFLHSSASKATLGSPTHSRRFLPCLEKRWFLFLRGLSDAHLHPGESWCQGCPSNGSGHLPNTALFSLLRHSALTLQSRHPLLKTLNLLSLNLPPCASCPLISLSSHSQPSMSVFRDGGHVFAKSFLFQDE